MVDKTVEIDGLAFPVYATLDEANAYMTGKYGVSMWFDSTTDPETKKRLLVTATRILDRQKWQGTPTGLSGQQLAWPRTGLECVAEDEIPEKLVYACVELANLILEGSDVESNVRPGVQTLQMIKAGSVQLQYFRDAESTFTKGARFPTVVQELIGKWLGGGGAAVAPSLSYGTDGESVTNEDYGFNQGI